MNKVILGLILVVCLLGMALVMLNERLGKKPEPVAVAQQEEQVAAIAPSKPEEALPEKTASGAIYERREAEEALAPPARVVETPPAQPQKVEAPVRIQPKPEPEMRPQPKPEVETKPQPKPEPEAKPEPRPEPAEAKKPEPKQERTEPKAASEKPKVEKSHDITRFVIFSREKGATVRMIGASPLHYKNMLLENPTRIVIDLDGDWKFPENPGIPKNDFVTAVRVGKMGDKTRLVLDLKEKPRVWRAIPSNNSENLDIRIDK